jgi:hypothetical protein
MLTFRPDLNDAAPTSRLGAVRDDLLLVLGVPRLNPLRTNEMNAISEGYALCQVPARRPAELAWAPLDELREAFHEVVSSRQTN